MGLFKQTEKQFIQRPTEKLHVEEVELNAKQEEAWKQTRSKFMWECPGFCHILYTMMNPARHDAKALFTKSIPVAATDGLYMYLNPDTFFKYTLPERVFIMAHEVSHAMFGHAAFNYNLGLKGKVKFIDGSELPYHNEIMQKAMDYVINDMLVDGKVGSCPAEGCHDPNLITHADTIVDAYRKVYKAQQNKPKGGNGSGPKGFDTLLKPGTAQGKNATQASQERNEQEWKTVVAAALAAAQAQGKLPASMKRLLGDLLEPQISWQEHIHGFFRRKQGSGSWNYRRPDRRLIVRDPNIYAPARSGFGVDTVVVAVDTSGSIGSKTIDIFMSEVAGVLEDVKPHKLFIIWCDAHVGRVDECEESSDLNHIRAKGAPGGGGTSFVPVFDEIRSLGIAPDALIYLTDGDGTFPQEAPAYSVLWGSILRGPKHYPFGEVVMIPKSQ